MAAPPLASDVQYGTREYGFNKLPLLQEMQTSFWASVVGMPATSKIEAAEQLTSSELSEESFAEGGEYLPHRGVGDEGIRRDPHRTAYSR